MLFFRVFQHLLPRGRAWSVVVQKTLRDFFLGLSEQPARTRTFADKVFLDAFPATARSASDVDPDERSGALEEWERHFGLTPSDPDDIDARRVALVAEWQATGGQSPSYIQGVLQAAGFDVYVHDWWSSGPPYVARDPRDYTNQPLVGSFQCTGEDPPGTPLPSQPQCSAFSSQPQCNNWLANEIHYLVNLDLTRRAPPRVPDDPDTFPYWFYIGAETFPELAEVDSARRAEFERLVLKLRPTHLWVGLLVSYLGEDDEAILEEDDDIITTEDDQAILVE